MRNFDKQIPHLFIEEWKNFYGRDKLKKCEIFGLVDKVCNLISKMIVNVNVNKMKE